uniref:Uncharacterized protein n=1 Tax=Timema bartmani TaxID=61472 RepID=A0A7R9EW32_9NEOP|nr:unnamed protein product [Timema bartmani]
MDLDPWCGGQCSYSSPMTSLVVTDSSQLTSDTQHLCVVGATTVDLQFSLEPEDTVVEPGNDAMLHCAAGGADNSKPTIRWRGTDGHFLNLIGERFRSPLQNGSLYFSKVHPTQNVDGEYQCVANLLEVGSIVSRTARLVIAIGAEGEGRVVQHTFPLIMSLSPGDQHSLDRYFEQLMRQMQQHALPLLESEPKDLTIFPGQTAYFSCLTQGVAQVVWLKDDRPLRLDETRMLVLPSGALEIDEVMSSDNGSYRCNVSSLGQFRLSLSAALSVNKDIAAGADIMAPEFIATPRPTTVVQGSTITLDCVANGNPKPWITWLKDGITLDMAHLDGPFLKIGTGSLQISNVQEKDSGTYQCRAENRDDSGDATANVDVQVPPYFTKKPSDHYGFVNKDVELECEIRGKPEPRVHWVKNGEQIKLNDYIQVVNGYNLRILGLMTLDAGMFQCIGSNPAGNIQAAARLMVLETGANDTFVHPPPALRSSVGDTLTAFVPPPLTAIPTSTDVAPGEVSPPSSKVPSAPQGLKAVIVSTRFVTISWKPPAEPRGDILTYSVFHRQEGSQRERVVNTTGSRLEEVNVPGLTPDRTYYFRVQAYNTEGPGESSDLLIVSTQAEVHVPGAPVGLRAVGTSPTSLLVQWEEPELNNGPVQRYKLYFMEGDSAEEHHVVTAERQYELKDLGKFTEYSLWVVAFNQNGPGSSTEEIVGRTLSDVPSEPPQNITLEATSSTSVVVRWEPPPKSGQNGVITGYKLRYRKRDRRSRGDTVSTDANRRMYALTGLERSSQYQVRLWALTVNGTGPPTEWFNIETFENDLDESHVPGQPVNLKTRAMADTITVSWSPPRDQNIMVRGYTIGWGKGIPDAYTQVLEGRQRFYVIEGLDNRYYVVRYTSSHHSSNPRYKYFNSTNLNCMIDDLRPNTQYEFTVKVLKNRRESPWSMVVLNMTQEAAPSSNPRDLTVVPVEGNPSSVNLNWQPPKQPNGAITGYVIFYTDDHKKHDRDWVVEGIVGDKMTTTITRLKPDTMYYFKIQARNNKGYGPFSSTVSFSTGPNGRGWTNSMVLFIAVGCGLVILSAIFVCIVVVYCRRRSVERSKKGYLKGNLKGTKPCKTSIKPPDLWIHHDQMELKALEKTQQSMGAAGGGPSTTDGPPITVTTLPRASQDFDDSKFQHPGGSNSLDKRTYVSSYIGSKPLLNHRGALLELEGRGEGQ